jgi:outer membrane protein OmpA-like peptidoglycan-associated protein
MKTLAAIGALGFMATGLFAQGLNAPSTQTKDDWEEINFEFNSSILSDGYPSLLRLADLLSQHRDYHVKVTGNTDSIGSGRQSRSGHHRRQRPSRSRSQ